MIQRQATPAPRKLILHVDDVGMCHGANRAFIELFDKRAVTTGSVMVPCPWFAEIAAAARADRTLDLGVHLTLTSEWDGYRWRALSTSNPRSGLLDDQGFLPKTVVALRQRLDPEAAEIEMRTQIDTALAAGIDVTHLDTHMGAALVPELLDVYLRLGRDYRLPLLLPRDIVSYLDRLRLGAVDPAPYVAAVEERDRIGVAVVDTFRMTPGVPSAEVEGTYRDLLMSVPPGLAFVSLHCNAPGDIETIVPPRAHWRTDEFALFDSRLPARWLADAGIETIGYRALREALRLTA